MDTDTGALDTGAAPADGFDVTPEGVHSHDASTSQTTTPPRRPIYANLTPHDADLGKRAQRRISQLLSDRHALEDRARRAEAMAREAHERLTAMSTETIGVMERATAADLTRAQEEIKRARADGDLDAELAAQARLSELSAELADLRGKKAQVTPQRTATGQEAGQAQGQTAPTQAQSQVSERTRAWMADNPWFAEDPAMQAAAIGLHHDALRRGIKLESDEYFAHINQRIRGAFPDAFDPEGETGGAEDEGNEATTTEPARTAAGGARPTAQSATVRRAAVTPQAAPKRTVRLSAEQREAARIAGVSEAQYAAHLARQR